MAQLRLQGTWTLALLLVAVAIIAGVPSSSAQTTNTTAVANTTATNRTSTNTTVRAPGPSPVKAPGPSPKKAPGPAPKKVPPPPPYYPPSKKRKNSVYGLVFGGIGLFAVVLGAILIHDFVKKVGYFKRKEHVDGKGALLHKDDFALQEPPVGGPNLGRGDV